MKKAATTRKKKKQNHPLGNYAEAVRRIVDMDETEHYCIIRDAQEQYLCRLGKSYQALADGLRNFPAFINWFRMQWQAHDPEFLLKYRHNKNLAPEIYAGYHRIQLEQAEFCSQVYQMYLSESKKANS